LEALDIVTQSLEEGHSKDVIFLGFAKAFDSVPHGRLLVKLKAYGIRDKLNGWCAAFLLNRTQRVVLGDSISDWLLVLSGVPQGSVLGPLLFLIFINDLVNGIKNNCKLYADDTKVISIIKDIEDNVALQHDMNRLVEWSNKWLIKFNADKCKVMHFGKKNQNYNYSLYEKTFDNKTIARSLIKTVEERDLGIILTNDLKWDHHINVAAGKAYKKLGLIKHSFSNLDEVSIKLLYTSLVRPHLEYGAPIWNPFLKKDIEKLEKVQHAATRIQQFKGLSYSQRLCKTMV
jgi:hypothetical protein